EFEPLVIADPVLQRIRGHGIGRAQISRGIASLAIEIRRHLIHIAPKFGLVGRTAGVEHSHDLPRSFAELHAVADVRVGKAVAYGFADDHFALAGLEPASLDQLRAGSKFEAIGHHATHGDVHFARAVLARKHDDHNPLARNHGLPVT